jgi:ABC-type branched-subunit amino acid transport system ATPase component
VPDTLALKVDDLTVRYGGVLAVDRVSLEVVATGITGLIGPNGAGKTSLFNACAGLVRPAGGTVELFGQDVTHRSPARRAHLGIGRTFQRIELFKTLTVRENVEMGPEAAFARRRPLSMLQALPSERREARATAERVMELCRITALADRIAGSLATGEQRMVEFARVLASPARLLLLDEPSSGLSAGERKRFSEILVDAAEGLGRAVFVVEHDMDLVASICRHVYVLNFGELIMSGTMEEAMASDAVQRSYLGEPLPKQEEREQEGERA